MVHSTETIRNQLTSVLQLVLDVDWPEKWGDFIPIVKHLLESNNLSEAYCGLLALLQLVNNFRWRSKNRKTVFYPIVDSTFPAVYQLATKAIEGNTVEEANVVTACLKIYVKSIGMDIPLSLQNSQTLIGWGNIFIKAVERPINEAELSEDADEREKQPWVKVRKWAYRCLNFLFTRYGNPATLDAKQQYLKFANQFIKHFAPNILKSYLSQLDQHLTQKTFQSSKCLILTAEFIGDCLKHKLTWQAVKPFIGHLVKDFIFPQLAYTEKDQELWEDNPTEFVQTRQQFLMDNNSPANACSNLVQLMAQDRKKHCLNGILELANGYLVKHRDTANLPNADQEKDSALAMIGAISTALSHTNPASVQMVEEFFQAFVIPELSSVNPFLRYRACELVSKFGRFRFTPQTTQVILTKIIDCLGHSEAPVKVSAAMALEPLISDEESAKIALPILPQIMTLLLTLTAEMELDNLTDLMEQFVEMFSEELAPFAIQLSTQLASTFNSLTGDLIKSEQQAQQIEANGFQESDEPYAFDDKLMSAQGILRTMGTLVISLDEKTDILAEVERVLMPVVGAVFQNYLFDLYDEALELLDCLLFSFKQVTPNLWSAFVLMITAAQHAGPTYVPSVFSTVENYINYGRTVIPTEPKLQSLFIDLYTTVMTSSDCEGHDRMLGARMMQYIFLCCQGEAIQNMIPSTLTPLFPHFGQQNLPKVFLINGIKLVLACLLNSTALTLSLMDQNNWVQGFFQLLINNLESLYGVHDKYLTIRTLVSIVELPIESVPQSVQNGLPQLLLAFTQLFQKLPSSEDTKLQRVREYDEDDFDDYYDEAEELNSEDGDDLENITDDGSIDDAYLAKLAESIKSQENDSDLYGSAGDDDSLMEEEDFMDNEMSCSPLHQLDIYVTVRDIFQALDQRLHPTYLKFISEMNDEQKQVIQEIFSTAANRNQSN
jgi:hypothetical protein